MAGVVRGNMICNQSSLAYVVFTLTEKGKNNV